MYAIRSYYEYVTSVNVTDTNIDEVIRFMIGRELGDLFPMKAEDSIVGDTILSVRNLNRGNVLFDVNFDLRSGEILGVAGLEGNGQDTLLRTVCGSFAKDSGAITIEGVEVRIEDPVDAIAAGLVLVTDKRHDEGRITSYNVCYTKLLRGVFVFKLK